MRLEVSSGREKPFATAFVLRPRQVTQAAEPYLLLPEDLTDPDAELRALPSQL